MRKGQLKNKVHKSSNGTVFVLGKRHTVNAAGDIFTISSSNTFRGEVKKDKSVFWFERETLGTDKPTDLDFEPIKIPFKERMDATTDRLQKRLSESIRSYTRKEGKRINDALEKLCALAPDVYASGGSGRSGIKLESVDYEGNEISANVSGITSREDALKIMNRVRAERFKASKKGGVTGEITATYEDPDIYKQYIAGMDGGFNVDESEDQSLNIAEQMAYVDDTEIDAYQEKLEREIDENKRWVDKLQSAEQKMYDAVEVYGIRIRSILEGMK